MDVKNNEYVTAYWSLWLHDTDSEISIAKQIDQLFTDYRYYPESEWSNYGYRPPESYSILGSWRNNTGETFIFLLETTDKQPSNQKQLLLCVVGSKLEMTKTEKKIQLYKGKLAKIDKKVLKEQKEISTLDRDNSQSIDRLIKLGGVSTVIINALSLYLRTIPTPNLYYTVFTEIYKILMIVIHILAIVLLLIYIIICLSFSIRYGFLLIKRLWY